MLKIGANSDYNIMVCQTSEGARLLMDFLQQNKESRTHSDQVVFDLAEIMSVKDGDVRRAASNALNRIYEVTPEQLISAKNMAGSLSLPVPRCGIPLINEKSEAVAESIAQVLKIPDRVFQSAFAREVTLVVSRLPDFGITALKRANELKEECK